MKKLVVALLVLFCSSVWAVDYPSTWPSRIDGLDFIVTGDGVAALSWEQDDGTRYCMAGNVWRIDNIAAAASALGEGETLSQYLERNKETLITRNLNTAETAACTTMALRNQAIWKVTPWRDKPTRNVYSLTNFPSVKTKIGEVAVGTECGATVAQYSATIKVYEWRKVMISAAGGPSVEGVTVCKKQ